ncbi:MAG: elongation factor P hydroxylase [Gammaproteobacteria bacterium]|nr:elongation factor P hydroxylase [Gammaproteobacteria bacterium]
MSQGPHHKLEDLFQQCFFSEYRTHLRGAAPEPLYQPASWPQHCHTIHYREDFFASALHEVAHWCIAGSRRRLLTDYGYWYHPDGRGRAQQRQFEQAECKPQALEWHFALACQWPFRLSSDNLAAGEGDNSGFAEAVRSRAQRYCSTGLPPRAVRFRAALAAGFAGIAEPRPTDFRSVSA